MKRCYRFLSSVGSANEDVEYEDALRDPNKDFKTLLTFKATWVIQCLTSCRWEEMEDDH